MRIEFTLTPQEISQAHDALFKHQAGVAGSKWKLIALLMVVLAIFYAFIYTQTSPAYRWPAMVLATLGVVILTIVLERAKKAGRPPEPVVLDVTEKGMAFVSGTGQSQVDWSSFARYLEIDDLFLIELAGSQTWIMVPRRVFAVPEELDRFRALLRLIGTTSAVVEAPTSPVVAPTRLPQSTRTIAAEFSYRFLDYLDLALSSWYTRGILLFALGVVVSAGLTVGRENGPGGSLSTMALMVVTMMVPAILFLVGVPLVFAARTWFADRHRHDVQSLQLTEQGITGRVAGGVNTLAWGKFSAFKEIRWSFLVWGKVAGSMHSNYQLIPKRALGGPENVEWLRSVLSARLTRSTWFFW